MQPYSNRLRRKVMKAFMLLAPGSNLKRIEVESPLELKDVRAMPRTEFEDAVRKRQQCVYLGNQRALCRILGRYKFFVSTSDVGFASHVMLDGFWETWLTQFILKTVKTDWVAIDVGANFGYYTLLLADLVGPKGTCLAIEPNPSVAAELKRSVSINGFSGRTKVIQAAATDGLASEVELETTLEEPKNASIVISGGAGPRLKVKAVSLDSVVKGLRRVDFIKIDAEGAEYLIALGMKDLIQEFRPDIVLEFNASRPAAQELLGLMQSQYGALHYLDFDGSIRATHEQVLLTERKGEDWLLYFHCSK